MEAGIAGFQDSQREACSTFFGAGCALFTDLYERLFVEDNNPQPLPPTPPVPPFGSTTMLELAPERIFFDGGIADQMRQELDLTEKEEIGMTNDVFGTVASNKLFDGTGTMAIKPRALWEL